MRKIVFILVLAVSYCFSVEAQNQDDEFEIDRYGKFRITSVEQAEVALVKVKSNVSASGVTFDKVEYNGKTYTVTSLMSDAFRDYSNSNTKFTFTNLRSFERGTFSYVTCHTIELSESPLTELPKSAFYKCHCSRILLPYSITIIPEKAFQWSDVSSLSLTRLAQIDGAAFYGCESLSSIDLSNVTYIGDAAFYDCSKLSSIDLSHVEYIGGSAFEGCGELKDITLPQCLETVNENAFEDCFLSSLSLCNTVKTFKNSGDIMASDGTVTMNIVKWDNKNVLADLTSLSQAITYKYDNAKIAGEYTLPDNLTNLGEGALYHCTDITAITMPAGLKQIGAKALAKCTKLSAIRCYAAIAPVVADANAFSEVDKNSVIVTIPDNAESYYSYIHTTGWKDFTNFAVSLQTIKAAAIIELNHTADSAPSQAVRDIIADYTTRINAATDKATVETLTQAGIEAIRAQKTIDRGLIKAGGLYYLLDDEHHTAIVTYGGFEADGYATVEYTGSINVPESVKYDNVTYNVTAIGAHAFQNCNGLTAISMPTTVTTIGDSAFYSCKGLKTVLLPTLLSSIGTKSFYACSLITSINCLAHTPCALGTDAFGEVSKSIPVCVPVSGLEAYQQGPWGGFTNFVTNPELDAAKTTAKSAITAALDSDYSISYVVNLALSFCLRIDAATTIEQVNALGVEGRYAVTYSASAYREFFGEMGEECDDCPAVDVTKGTKTVRLYNPEKVKIIKKPAID